MKCIYDLFGLKLIPIFFEVKDRSVIDKSKTYTMYIPYSSSPKIGEKLKFNTSLKNSKFFEDSLHTGKLIRI